MGDRRVVVTGIGCLSPLGHSPKETWSSALEGKSGAATIKSWDCSEADVRFACEVKDLDLSRYLSPKELKRMDRFISMGLVASDQALEDSGNLKGHDPEKIGVFLSSGIGGLIKIEETTLAANSGRKINPFFIPASISNLLPGHVSIKHGFLGPNFCITSACSSSAHSIGEAFLKIRYGELDAVVAGGSEAPISRLGVGGFASMKALSKRNDEPERASRPFDRDRDGFVIGEGAVTLILEEESLARKRGATIYGEIVGYGANADAFHLTAPSSDGKGAGRCMELALKQAQVSVDQVSYINMHGTSTPLGDVAETNAIKRVFGDSSHQVVCSSTKSMTGHLLGAAGSIEAMFTLFSLKNSKITPTINLENQDEECDLDYCANEARELDVKFALSNSFGFGGTNASLLFQRYD